MTEAEILAILDRLKTENVPLSDAQKQEILEWLRRRMSAKTIKDFVYDPTKPPSGPTAWDKFLRFIRAPHSKFWRALWLIPIYMAGALIIDSNFVDPPSIASGKGPCSVNTRPIPITASATTYGPNAALRDAIAELERKCAASGIVCTDPRCPTCGGDVQITSVDITDYILVYTADVTANCACWCK
jgi:hypothetical protein